MQMIKCLGQDVLQLPPQDCELLYGRCGYIYALMFARQYTGHDSPSSQQLIKALLKQIVEEGKKTVQQVGTSFNLLYQWHGTLYLGGVPSVQTL